MARVWIEGVGRDRAGVSLLSHHRSRSSVAQTITGTDRRLSTANTDWHWNSFSGPKHPPDDLGLADMVTADSQSLPLGHLEGSWCTCHGCRAQPTTLRSSGWPNAAREIAKTTKQENSASILIPGALLLLIGTREIGIIKERDPEASEQSGSGHLKVGSDKNRVPRRFHMPAATASLRHGL